MNPNNTPAPGAWPTEIEIAAELLARYNGNARGNKIAKKSFVDAIEWIKERHDQFASIAGEVKEQVVCRWVKASERLPEHCPVAAKYGFHYGELVEHHGYYSFSAKGTYVTVKYNSPALKDIEWLEQVTTPLPIDPKGEAAINRLDELENELFRLYTMEGLANAASKANSTKWLIKKSIFSDIPQYPDSKGEAEKAAEEYANGFYRIKPYDHYESDYDYRTQCAKNRQLQEHFLAGVKWKGDNGIDDWKYQAKALSAIKKGLEVALKDAMEECERLANMEGNDFLSVLVENYQAQIAGYYNDDKTNADREKRQAVIDEYEDLIAIYKAGAWKGDKEAVGDQEKLWDEAFTLIYGGTPYRFSYPENIEYLKNNYSLYKSKT